MDTPHTLVESIAIYKRIPEKDFMIYISAKTLKFSDRLILRAENFEQVPLPGEKYFFRVRENQVVEKFWQ